MVRRRVRPSQRDATRGARDARGSPFANGGGMGSRIAFFRQCGDSFSGVHAFRLEAFRLANPAQTRHQNTRGSENLYLRRPQGHKPPN